MQKVIMEDGVEMITQLLAQKAFINFGECWQYADWTVGFFNEGVIFFKYWCYLGHFELGWECFFGLHFVGHFKPPPPPPVVLTAFHSKAVFLLLLIRC